MTDETQGLLLGEPLADPPAAAAKVRRHPWFLAPVALVLLVARRSTTTRLDATETLSLRPLPNNVLCYEASVQGVIAYRPVGETQWLWSTKMLCRLRLNTTYEVEVHARRRVIRRTFTTGSVVGLEGKFAQVRGNLSVPLLTVQHVVGTWNETRWMGLATFDRDGYVVWYHEVPGNSTLYLVAAHEDGSNFAVMRVIEGGARDSALLSLAPTGDVLKEYTNECYGQFTHEVRPSNGTMLTLGYDVRTYGDASDLEKLSPGLAKAWTESYGDEPVRYVGERIYLWHVETEELEASYSIFDVLNPLRNGFPSSDYSWLELRCSDAGIEWSHGSSANYDADGDFLVTFRNLQLVLALFRDGSGVKWAVSSVDDLWTGDESFPVYWMSEDDKFWEPHSITSVSSDIFYLVDDGTSRPNCASPYSRGVGYKLDETTRQATLIWQFQYEHVYNIDGGGIVPLDETILVAFTAVIVGDDDDDGRPAYIFEVGRRDGAIHAIVKVPRVPVSHKSGSYRVEVSNSIAGESYTKPL